MRVTVTKYGSALTHAETRDTDYEVGMRVRVWVRVRICVCCVGAVQCDGKRDVKDGF